MGSAVESGDFYFVTVDAEFMNEETKVGVLVK
jgi:hypothetical protein